MAANNDPPLISDYSRYIVECRRLLGEAHINRQNRGHEYGITAFHIASIVSNLEILELLTSSGADVDIRDDYGYGGSKLHYAPRNGRLKISAMPES